MGRGAWWAAVCGVGQSWTRLKRLNSSSSSHSLQLSSHHWGGGALPPRVAPGPLTGLRAPQGARSRCCLPAGRGVAASDTVLGRRLTPAGSCTAAQLRGRCSKQQPPSRPACPGFSVLYRNSGSAKSRSDRKNVKLFSQCLDDGPSPS